MCMQIFKESTEKVDDRSSVIRIYSIRKKIDTACVMKGSLPTKNY